MPADDSANLSLYMGNQVGLRRGIVRLTDVEGILVRECVTADRFHAPAHPTYLIYNPHAEEKAVSLDVGPRMRNLYDLVSRAPSTGSVRAS